MRERTNEEVLADAFRTPDGLAAAAALAAYGSIYLDQPVTAENLSAHNRIKEYLREAGFVLKLVPVTPELKMPLRPEENAIDAILKEGPHE